MIILRQKEYAREITSDKARKQVAKMAGKYLQIADTAAAGQQLNTCFKDNIKPGQLSSILSGISKKRTDRRESIQRLVSKYNGELKKGSTARIPLREFKKELRGRFSSAFNI